MSYPVDGAPGIWCHSFVGKAFLINVPLALWIAARVYNLRLPPGSHTGRRPVIECPQLISGCRTATCAVWPHSDELADPTVQGRDRRDNIGEMNKWLWSAVGFACMAHFRERVERR